LAGVLVVQVMVALLLVSAVACALLITGAGGMVANDESVEVLACP